jgi:SAM-dependent methyltransferase
MEFGPEYSRFFIRNTERIAQDIDFISKFAPKGSVCIDAGCGDGSHAAQKRKSGVKFISGDLGIMPIPKNSLTFSLFSSFGYEGYEQVLSNISASLIPGGTLIIDLHNPSLKIPTISKEPILSDGYEIREFYDQKSSIWTSCIHYPNGKTEKFSLRFFTPPEIETLLKSVGILVQDLFGDFDGSKYSTKSRRLIVVAKKPS